MALTAHQVSGFKRLRSEQNCLNKFRIKLFIKINYPYKDPRERDFMFLYRAILDN